jgi:serine/threonine protein kinase
LRLLSPLDAGATAVVMKAEKRKNGKILGYFAVKCILKTYFDCKDKSLASIRWNCFERERQIMEKLSNKFVIKYIEPYTTKNYMIFVQEYANAGNLKDLLYREGGSLKESIAKNVMS